MNMDILNVYPITGLYNELYSPNVTQFNNEPLDFLCGNPLNRVNSLFWATLFSRANLEKLVFKMRESSSNNGQLSEIEKAVLANCELFISLVHSAPKAITNQAISEREMFAYIERIEIACKLFSKYIFHPFQLTIQDGFLEPDISAKFLIDNLFNNKANPYLKFLEENVFSGLDTLNPKLIWINGQPKFSSMAMSAYIKKKNPNVCIAIRYHSSEYYSLNKIEELLKANTSLFSLIDCIVLDDNRETISQIEKAVVGQERPLGSCRNIIYIDRKKDEIISTHIERVDYHFDECINSRLNDGVTQNGHISPSEVVNLKLNPNTACHWNKCSFCAINKKYKYIQNKEFQDVNCKLDIIEKFIRQNAKYFWFEDEALTSSQLQEFAKAILARHLKFQWQARARISLDFDSKIAKELYRAGLREIRFGLESASVRILGLMNKFPKEVTLNTVEFIVKVFTQEGIHVHFPMIVGFPTESVEERIETYKYLSMLREKYKNVSYNINILMLDIASELFKNFPNYGITTVSFPCSPYDFLGNTVNYGCANMDEDFVSIDIKRNEFMRTTLYPWMPQTSQIKPNIFYRLTETIRNTLLWHCDSINHNKKVIHESSLFEKSNLLSVWKEPNGRKRIYDWFTHRVFELTDEDYEKFSSIRILRKNEVYKSQFYKELFENNLIILKE